MMTPFFSALDMIKFHANHAILENLSSKINTGSDSSFGHLPIPEFDPMKMRLEMLTNKGFEIIAPDLVFPKLEVEPFTKEEWADIYRYRPQSNISKLRSIIRRQKNKHE